MLWDVFNEQIISRGLCHLLWMETMQIEIQNFILEITESELQNVSQRCEM
jgi:hypothetical protein